MRMHPKKLAILCLVVISAVASGAWTVPGGSIADEVRDDEIARCTFDIIARNSNSKTVYLDLYTSNVFGGGVLSRSTLKIQNAKVFAGRTLSPQRVRVGGNCGRSRQWFIHFRRSSSGKRDTKVKNTGSSTRVGSSTGNRVLNLGDVGKW